MYLNIYIIIIIILSYYRGMRSKRKREEEAYNGGADKCDGSRAYSIYYIAYNNKRSTRQTRIIPHYTIRRGGGGGGDDVDTDVRPDKTTCARRPAPAADAER